MAKTIDSVTVKVATEIVTSAETMRCALALVNLWLARNPSCYVGVSIEEDGTQRVHVEEREAS